MVHEQFAGWRGGPDTALSVWVVEQQEVAERTLAFQSLVFLRHPDVQSDVGATPLTLLPLPTGGVTFRDDMAVRRGPG